MNSQTQTFITRIDKEMRELKSDVLKMRKLLVNFLIDEEGEYTGYFIKKMVERSKSKGPFHQFNDKESFLQHVQSGK